MKTVLITGASRGIGRGLALAFAKAGYAVAINCVEQTAKAQAVVKEARSQGAAEIDVFPADIRHSDQASALIEAVVKRWGRLDVLVNNAGITRDRTILKMTDEEWTDVLAVNLTGPFWCLRAAAQIMIRQGQGSILNVASIMGYRGGFGNANYSASKAGLVALTKSAARELGRFQIRVNAVLPGFHETDMSAPLPPERRQKLLAEHPLGRSTRLDDLAAMTISLVENPSISGQVYNVDSRIIGG
jgi:NAD(P)-dependent dehydrogenase (short-subunit alcohol dehydrogenase family)